MGARFEIEKFAEGNPVYYVIETGVDSPGGVFDGVVNDIGWKGNEILARIERLSSSDPSGWYILNINTGVVSGPIENISKISSFKVVDVENFYADPAKYRE